jgi:hypothetical protein
MKKIITTLALALAETSAAHGVTGDNPFQLAARFKTKPIVVEQMTPRADETHEHKGDLKEW